MAARELITDRYFTQLRNVDLDFFNCFELLTQGSLISNVILADQTLVPITRESLPFSIRLGNISTTISGPVCPRLSHQVIAGLDWLRHIKPHIDWDTSILNIKRNGVNFHVYPNEVTRAFKDCIFVHLIHLDGTEILQHQLSFENCQVS